jgi:hypothetical protein
MKISNLIDLYNLFLVHVTVTILITWQFKIVYKDTHSLNVICGKVSLYGCHIIFHFIPLHSSNMLFVLHSSAFCIITYELPYSEYFDCQTASSLTLWLYSPRRNFASFQNADSEFSTQHPLLVFIIYIVSRLASHLNPTWRTKGYLSSALCSLTCLALGILPELIPPLT